nr:MAG TPA: hypothetical protein [Caudoviricetes sp.]
MEKDKIEIIENEFGGSTLIINGAQIKKCLGYSLVDNKTIDNDQKYIQVKIFSPEIEYKKGR